MGCSSFFLIYQRKVVQPCYKYCDCKIQKKEKGGIIAQFWCNERNVSYNQSYKSDLSLGGCNADCKRMLNLCYKTHFSLKKFGGEQKRV